MINGERHGLFVGEAKLRKKKRVGEMFYKSVTAPSPQHVKEGLLSANSLRLLPPGDDIVSANEDMRDAAMEVIYKNNFLPNPWSSKVYKYLLSRRYVSSLLW